MEKKINYGELYGVLPGETDFSGAIARSLKDGKKNLSGEFLKMVSDKYEDEGEYWVEEFPYEFPYCQTIVWYHPESGENYGVVTQSTSYLGWSTMAKQGGWYFMIIEKKV